MRGRHEVGCPEQSWGAMDQGDRASLSGERLCSPGRKHKCIRGTQKRPLWTALDVPVLLGTPGANLRGERNCIGRSVWSCSAGRACCCPGTAGILPGSCTALSPHDPSPVQGCALGPWAVLAVGPTGRVPPAASGTQADPRFDGQLWSDGRVRAHGVQGGGSSGGEGLAALRWLFCVLAEHKRASVSRSRIPFPSRVFRFFLSLWAGS